jgi:hypothetical protein
MKTTSAKKRILTISICLTACLVLAFGAYFAVHTYANGQIHEMYAEDFKKNPLGDYTKNESDVILAVYDAPLFQTYTNLSAHNTKSKVGLIIWVPLYNGEKEYGFTITDDEEKITHQIEVNDRLQAETEQENELLQKNKEAIDEILSVVRANWNISFDK